LIANTLNVFFPCKLI